MPKKANDFSDVRRIIKYVEDLNNEHKLTGKRLNEIQGDINEINEKYEYDASVEEKRYQLYELQALVSYFAEDYESAEAFALEARDLKPIGATYVSSTVPVIISVANGSFVKKEDSRKRSNVSFASYLKSKPDSNIVFYQRSPIYVAWMSFLSLNIYNLYWFYKQWRYISLSTKEKTFPILSSIFQIFTAFSLFKKIASSAEDKKIPKSIDYGTLATLYIAVIIAGKAVGKLEFSSPDMVWGYFFAVLALSLITALVTAKVQAIANASNSKLRTELPAESKMLPGEILFGITGFIFAVLFLIGTFGTLISNTYPRGNDAEISQAKLTMDGFSEEYDKCSKELNVIYADIDDTDQAAVDSYNSQYDACESVRLKQNSAADRYNYLLGY